SIGKTKRGGTLGMTGVGRGDHTAVTLAAAEVEFRHEALLNVAFAGQPAWRLMCPYGTTTLPPDVIDEAQRSHPFIVEGQVERDSPYCRDLASMAAPFDVPLLAPSEFEEVTFDADSLGVLRRLVSRRAMDAGLGMTRAGELAFSVHELAANSVRHGG